MRSNETKEGTRGSIESQSPTKSWCEFLLCGARQSANIRDSVSSEFKEILITNSSKSEQKSQDLIVEGLALSSAQVLYRLKEQVKNREDGMVATAYRITEDNEALSVEWSHIGDTALFVAIQQGNKLSLHE